MNNIIYIDPIYIKHSRMWDSDRWRFSSIMVNLTIKKSHEGLNEEEQNLLNTLNRIVEENNGNWLEEPKQHTRKKKGKPFT